MKKITLLTLLLFHGLWLNAQSGNDTRKKWISNLFNTTVISVSPFQKSYLNGASTVVDYKLFKGLATGIGAGYTRLINMNTYDTVEANFHLLPVFADFRYFILHKVNSPFMVLDAGYVFLLAHTSSPEGYKYIEVYPPYAWTDKYFYDKYSSGGIYLSTDLGYRFRIGAKLSLTASLNYTLMQVHGSHQVGYYQHLPDGENGTKVIITYEQWDVMAYMNLFLIKVGVQIF